MKETHLGHRYAYVVAGMVPTASTATGALIFLPGLAAISESAWSRKSRKILTLCGAATM